MPAFNTARYIGAALESVLAQRGVEFEVIVVDDGSTDGTADAVRAFKDPRVRLISNGSNRGISYCHNLVLAQSRAPFIAHVDSDDIVFPGAFATMLSAISGDPTIGQAHCYFYEIDESGVATEAAMRARRARLETDRPVGMDYKRELLARGAVMNHLRTYRREVFEIVGYFNERLRYAEDYEMALRVIDKYAIKLVPEFLYGLRTHPDSSTRRSGYTSLDFLRQRWAICRQLAQSREVTFLAERQYDMNRLMLLSCWQIWCDYVFRLRSKLRAHL